MSDPLLQETVEINPEPQETAEEALAFTTIEAQPPQEEAPQVVEPAEPPEPEAPKEIMEDRYWSKNGWSAKVIKNEDDDGWAVEICKEGIPEPVLVSPWVMGRDKKNPKPFDAPSFATFVKTASEVMRRAAQQRERALKKNATIYVGSQYYRVFMEIIPDEYDPHAILSALDPEGEQVAKIRVLPNYKFTQANLEKWAKGGFKEM